MRGCGWVRVFMFISSSESIGAEESGVDQVRKEMGWVGRE